MKKQHLESARGLYDVAQCLGYLTEPIEQIVGTEAALCRKAYTALVKAGFDHETANQIIVLRGINLANIGGLKIAIADNGGMDDTALGDVGGE